ncbi:MAG: SDR family oxidoreductase [Anaerolineaceae bacterium]|nr:SDR family oxidoreductase [Anaerolineaceae bacterium]
MLNQFRLDGKFALVTGGTGVLGRAMCQALAGAGASVIVLARNGERAANFAAELGQGADSFAADVMDKAALERCADHIRAQYGRMDILVNCAGGNHKNATAVPNERSFFDLPADALQWVLNLNLMGTILPSQVFGALMAEQKQGVILNVSSMASIRPLTRVVAYAGAKAAVNNFTQWLAVTMAQDYSPHIRVNAIAPGFFIGEQNYYLLYNEDDTLSARGQQIIDHTPMNRFGKPEDLQGTVLWLVSDASRFVTGIVVPVDGGFSAFSGV